MSAIRLFSILQILVGFVSSDFDPAIHQKFETLPSIQFLDYFNSLNHSWTTTKYNIEVQMLNGVLPDASTQRLTAVKGSVKELPRNFDARKKWGRCSSIRRINYQGQCESCFLFATINSISDRTCIHTGDDVELAVQEGACIFKGGGCSTGYSEDVFNYWVQYGLVTEQCTPYNISSLRKAICSRQCTISGVNYKKYFGKKYYTLPADPNSIRADIFKNGPVEALFNLYEDFKQYEGGIYEHTFGKRKGRHSVRVIGYGAENGIDFWLVANSWGTKWGEKGFAKIKCNHGALDFENNVSAGLPRLTSKEVNESKNI